MTLFSVKSLRSLFCFSAAIAVRLERSIKVWVRGASLLISVSICGFISGAPPVMSMVSNLNLVASFKTSTTVFSAMISWRVGPASRWQCLQL